MLNPPKKLAGCDQYHLVSLDLTLHDSPTKLLWRPGERAASLRLVLLRSGAGYDEFTFFRESSSQLQYDMTFRRVSGVLGATCVVASASLDVSCACRKNQTEINSFYVESFDDDGTKTPSYFSLDCEDDAEANANPPEPTASSLKSSAFLEGRHPSLGKQVVNGPTQPRNEIHH
ncbi:uncharacterized protein LOC119569877 [Penaeus monodon]|uniref:uncharacterized protein LOC119569877 n=1 Tax=Penaeus monodon TaxID=6687 RepID=UPI0018A72C9B|nr:uncharacterized protein LOC119569877 [Penaeus monodon]